MLVLILTLFSVKDIYASDIYDYSYTGDAQTFTAPIAGKYKLEVWGAQGGNGSGSAAYRGGYGSYSIGYVNLEKNQVIYIYVGGQGNYGSGVRVAGGYNGGGTTTSGGDKNSGSGGGATHIALDSGLLPTFSSKRDRLLIVAAGGGGGCVEGSYYKSTGGHAGGFKGENGNFYNSDGSVNSSRTAGGGGTQNSGGSSPSGGGSFGQGGGSSNGAGGGGGFFGGGAGLDGTSAGGGSGYIGNSLLTDKMMVMYSTNSSYASSTESTKTVLTTASNNEPISNTAKLGNGAARITYIDGPSDNNLKSLKINKGKMSPIFKPSITEYTLKINKTTTNINVEAETKSAYATIIGDGDRNVSTDDDINIYVTSQDGEIKTYTIHIFRYNDESCSTKLSKLFVGNYHKDINFDSDVLSYDLSINSSTVDLPIGYKMVDSNSKVSVTGNDSDYIKNNNEGIINVLVQSNNCENTTYTINWAKESDAEFLSTGEEQSYMASKKGIYKLEVWGAQGGSKTDSGHSGYGTIRGGYGGYSTGNVILNKNDTLYVFVGQKGVSNNSSSTSNDTIYAYPNGGAISAGGNSGSYQITYNGGGASTHISKSNKVISDIDSNNDDLLIVAGGGGGVANYWDYTANGGEAGGFTGNSTTSNFNNKNAIGGTQSTGGASGGNSDGIIIAGVYGIGGGRLSKGNITSVSGAGGGGYYGGGASWGGSGAGGSGYINNDSLFNKSMYCYNCKESSDVSTYTVSTYGTTTHSSERDTVNCSSGVSVNAVSKCAKSGNGSAKISYLGPSDDNYLKQLSVSKGKLSPEFDPDIEEYTVKLNSSTDSININAEPSSDYALMSDVGNYNIGSDEKDINISVTAYDGEIRTYTIHIQRFENSNHSSELSNIMINNYSNDLKFSSDIFDYDLVLPLDETNLIINYTKKDSSSKVRIDGNDEELISNGNNGTITLTVESDYCEDTVYRINWTKKDLNPQGFSYVGGVQSFVVPKTGKYKIELWGAQGGSYEGDHTGEKGAYTSGIIDLQVNNQLFVYVGQGEGSQNGVAFNGTTSSSGGGTPGGGATDVRLINGTWNNAESLRSRIMVAAGGGSTQGGSWGGAAGGLTGYSSSRDGYTNTGGSQTAGGKYSTADACGNGTFGVGSTCGATGGGGYYGGSGAAHAYGSGAGGSSYISGHTGCVAIESKTSSSPKPGCSTGTNDQNCSISPYEYSFTNTKMIDGLGYNWTNKKENIELMPNPINGFYDFGEGRSGHGYAKISYIDEKDQMDNTLKSISVSEGKLSPEFDSSIKKYKVRLNSDVTKVKVSAETNSISSELSGIGEYDLTDKNFTDANLMVTSLDGNVNIYSVSLEKTGHTASLKSLVTNNDPTEIDFNPKIKEYNIVILTTTYKVPISYKTVDPDATVEVVGNDILTLKRNTSGVIVIKVTAPDCYNEYKIYWNKISVPSSYDYGYTGGQQTFTVPYTGTYQLQVWGAAGGGYSNRSGGYGGYSLGRIKLNKGKVVYINVGQEGTGAKKTQNPTYNGGGGSYCSDSQMGTGGGATHMALVSGELKYLSGHMGNYIAANGTYDSKNILIVAGGGGGAYYYANNKKYFGTGGHAGGYQAGTAYNNRNGSKTYTSGGTQTSGYSFGQGVTNTSGCRAGGGGGWYGGPNGVNSTPGGSGYIGNTDLFYKHMACYDCPTSTATHTYTKSVTCVSRGSHDCVSNGNGYAIITYVAESSDDNYLLSLTSDKGTFVENFDPENTEYTLQLGPYDDEFTLSGEKSNTNASVSGFKTYQMENDVMEVQIPVTSQTGSVRVYSIYVTKGTAVDRSIRLRSLKIEGHTLSPKFSSLEEEYTTEISQGEVSVEVEAIPYDKKSKVTVKGNGYLAKSRQNVITVTVEKENVGKTEYVVHVNREGSIAGETYTYSCVGYGQEFNAKATTYYKIEAWGARGGKGRADGKAKKIYGKGAYTSGEIRLDKGTTFYVYVGCAGSISTGKYVTGGAGGYNGGAKGGNDNSANPESTAKDAGGGGGGASDIRLVSGSAEDFAGLKSRIMVAGGGGGGEFGHKGEAGGGLVAYHPSDSIPNAGQTSGYKFGIGMPGKAGKSGAGGGAGGYYGGYSGKQIGGGGGSSYVSGCSGCNSINPSSSSFEDISHTGSPNHYSGYVFDNISMIDGDYNMPSPSGGYMTGNENDGKIIITALGDRSADNFLRELTVDKGELSPVFELENTEYNVELTPEDDEITISAKLSDDKASMTGTGTFDVPAGTTTFPIVVTAENGDIRTYNVNVTREKSSNSKPKEIVVSGLVPSLCALNPDYCNVEPEFDPETNEYTLTVPSRIKELEFTVIKGHKYQTVSGDGIIRLEGGENTHEVVVTSEDETNESVYTYTIIRDMTGNNNIESLNVIDPAININFSPDVTEYYFSVPNTYESIVLEVILEDELATYEVIGNENFKLGNNIVIVRVTSQNGYTKDYLLNVYREKSGNVFLSDLKVKHNETEFTLTPTFDKTTTSYITNVENEIDEVEIVATAEHSLTTIMGDGVKELRTGTNIFNITTTSDNGNTEVYKVSVVRAKNSDATLKTLEIEEGELSEEFNPLVNSYSIDVPAGTTNLTINAVPTKETSTVTINKNKGFIAGQNEVTILVTAEDGTKNTYVLNVNRLYSTNNYLKLLDTDRYDIEFNKETEEYEFTIENEYSDITVSAEAEDPLSKVSGTGKYTLKTGYNNIDIDVTSEDGDIRTYSLKVNRKQNSNANLFRIDTDYEQELDPEFNKDTLEYTITVDNLFKSINITGIPEVTTSKVSGNGNYDLVVGDNIIKLTVTAEDKTTKEYTINVIRKKSSNANLIKLNVEEGLLEPKFNKETTNYDVKVLYNVNYLNIDYETENEGATVKVEGNKDLVIGNNEVKLIVTSEDKSVTKEYVINVIKQEEGTTSNKLKSLNLEEKELQPVFNKNTMYYTAEVPYSITKATLTGEPEDVNATVTGLGNYDLEVGENILGVKVTSTEGIERTYQVVVTRKENDDARLSSLTVEDSILNPIFNKDVFNYSLTTQFKELNITATPLVEGATYEVIGNSLVLGSNEVIVRVTAKDRVTTKDYVLNVTKEKSNNNNLAWLKAYGTTLTPEFSKTTTVYYGEVERNINTIQVDGEPEDESATVEGLGECNLEVGENIIEINVISESGNSKKYAVVITRKANDNNYLSELNTSSGDLNPVFDKEELEYTVNIPYEEDEITFTGKTEDENATVEGLTKHKIEVGENEINIVVTSEKGTKRTYKVNVIRDNLVSSLLTELKVKDYEITPSFVSENFEYNVDVDYEIENLDISYKTVDPGATVVVEGNSNFIVGLNKVFIKVTDRLGRGTSTYILNVNRQTKANVYLAYIDVSKGVLTPEFDKEVLSYTVEVSEKTDSIRINSEAEVEANVVTGNGTFDLERGINKFPLTVSSPKGITKTYHVTVIRKLRDDNYLLTLNPKVDNELKTLDPTFDKDVNDYTLVVPAGTDNVNYDGTISDGATVEGLGTKSVRIGSTNQKISVTSESGNVRVYNVLVNREASTENHLISLVPSVGTLVPTYTYSNNTYNLDLDSSASVLSFEYEMLDINSTVEGTEEEIVPDGLSVREIVVTAEDGTKNTYTVNVNKSRSDEARLSNLKVNGYTLDKEFDKDTFNYSITVPNNKTTLRGSEVEATPIDDNAEVTKPVKIDLSTINDNVFNITVTAPDGFTKNVYTINVIREKGSEALLESLRTSVGEITPDFKSNTFNYTLNVPRGITELKASDFVATATTEDATITKMDKLVINDDTNIYTITVTSGNGTVSNTYSLTVNKILSSDATIAELNTNIGIWESSFNRLEYKYTINVATSDNEILITGRPYSYATITGGLGRHSLPERENKIDVISEAEDGTILIYELNIIKSIEKDTKLQNISLGGDCNDILCPLVPIYQSNTYDYKVNVDSDIKNITIDYVKKFEDQIVTVYDKKNKEVTGTYSLVEGDNRLRIVVENGISEATTYNVNVVLGYSTNNFLSELSITNPITNETRIDFNKYVQEYDVEVDNDVDEIEVHAVKEHPKSILNISGSKGLVEGNNDVLITVISENGELRTYVIHVFRNLSSNNYLESITVSSGVIYRLTPRFKKGVYDYQTTVPADVSKVNIDAVPELETTEVLGTGEKNLVTGFNKFNLVSTSIEGTVSVFHITINRLKPDKLYLRSLNVEESPLEPEFSKYTYKYNLNIDSSVNKLNIEALPEIEDTKVKIVGNNNLTSGKNTIYIVLTSSDNLLTTSYVLEVNKGISENKDLLKILLDKTELEGFNKDITEYEKEYEYNKEKVEVEGILEDKNSKIEGNGIYSLEEGNNEVKLTVTSEKGETKVYTINIVRKYNTYLKDIVTDRGRLVPSFNKETNNYEIEVENEIKDITVIGLPESSEAEVEGNNKYDLTVGNNEIVLKVKNHGYENNYNIVVKRKANSNTNLKYLLVSEGILDKEYSNEINKYEVHVPSDIRSISLSYEPEVETTRVEEIGNNLTENEQYVTLKVIASDNTERDIRIKVIKDEEPLYSNKLLDIKVDKGELSPVFDPDIQEYTVHVASTVNQINVTVVRESNRATVEGDGGHSLEIGRNVIPIIVTSKDGIKRIYTLTVIRASSEDARLEKLEFNEGYLTPIFNSDVYNYTLTCDPETALVTIKEIKTIDENASYEVTGGEIKNGTSLIQIKVTSADKTNSKTYKILAKLAKSNNAYLKDITLSVGELNPVFNKEINAYEVEVESNVEDIIIKGIPESTKAYVTGNTKYELEYGKNYVNIIVTAEAGNTNVYSIVIERKQSDNTYLKDLSVKGYEISPEFDKEELNYELEVDYFVTKVEILGEAEDPLSRVMGLGEKDLKEGNNLFSIIVTSQTGDIREYKINILRNRLISSKLLDLDIKEGVLSPEFNKSIEYYTTEIPYEYTKVTEIVELEDKNASYEVIGNNDLQVGENEVDIVVTSSDNKEVTTYHLLVRRNVLTNNYLESLEVSEGRLTPVFDKNIVYYEVEVDNLIETIEVTARPESISTEVRGNGEYNLEVGKNKIIIESTGQNGITRYTKVIVTRKHEENNYLLDIIPSVGVLNPAFIKSHEMYEVEVPVGTTEISFEVVKESEKSTVTGDGTHQIQGGENQVDILVTSEKGEVRVYSINVIRPLDNNTNIVSITPSTSEIEPEYNNEVYEYSIKVDKDTNILDLEVELESPLAKVSGNKGIIVDELLKTVTITVTAEDGTIREVEITIEKESSLIDIEVEENDVIIMKGDTYQIKANTVPEGRRLTYTAEDTEIINVSEEGSVFGLKEGTTKVKVTSPENEYLEKEVQITVLSDKLESDIYSVEDREYRIVIGSEPQTTVKDYKLNLKNRYEHIKIYDKDGNELSEETSVGTGLIIKLEFNGKVYDEATIVVRGDIDGDSIVNVSDYMIALNHAIESEFIEDMIQFYAADVDPTDTVNVTDYLKIMDYALDPENAESLN